MAIVAAFAFGVFFVGIDHAADEGALWAVSFSRMAAVAVALGSLYPLATVVLARAVLHERVSLHQRTGVLTALTGIALVSLA